MSVLPLAAWLASRPEPAEPRPAPPVLFLSGCDDCGREATKDQFFIRLGSRGHLCVRCWRLAGRPTADDEPTIDQVHAAELATRERMQHRGGADRHMVRAGKS